MIKCGRASGALWIAPKQKSKSDDPEMAVVLPCCYTSKARISQYVPAESLNNMANAPHLVDMRKSLANGDTPDLCRECIHLDEFKHRRESIATFDNKGVVKETIHTNDIEEVHITLSNLCNLKCIMCGSSNSHLIAKEEKMIHPLNTFSDEWFDEFVNFIECSPRLRNITLTGGEPLYNKDRFIRILKATNSNIHINVHTNGTLLDDTILSEMRRANVKAISLDLSIDGMAGTFEYQRTKGNWVDVVKNINSLHKLTKDIEHIDLRCNYTYTCFNLHTIARFESRYGEIFKSIFYNKLHYPNEMRTDLCKPEHISNCINELKAVINEHNSKRIENVIKYLEDDLSSTVPEDRIKQLWKTVDYMRDVRGIDLKEKIPEAYDFLRKPND